MEQKNWKKSLTLIATGVITILIVALRVTGQAETAEVISNEQAEIIEWFISIGTIISSAIAFYGRVRASTQITFKKRSNVK